MTNFITETDQLEQLLLLEKFTFVYFKNDRCSVCDSLLPQLKLRTDSWNQELYVVDCFNYPEIAAQNLVLTVPALKVYYDGQEVISMLRFVDLSKLENDFLRINKLIG